VGSAERRDFFISYAGPDRPWATWLAGLLDAAGYSVEIDVWDWPPGTDAAAQMNGALARADRVLALWTPRYFDPASWAGPELSAAFYLNHAEQGRLVPVVVEPVRPGPLYDPLIRIDIAGRDEDDARRELLDRLRSRDGRGSAQPYPGVRFPDRPPPVFQVPPRNPSFTGRDRMLEQLHDALASDDSLVLEALHGMGGVGKTQLAVEYAHRFAPDYDLVWWIDAEQTAVITESFSQLARRLGLPEGMSGPEAVAAVLDELRRRERWLLVFDNAERPEQLQPFRPSASAGHVIVTSRFAGWGAIGSRVGVDVLSRAESVHLLQHRLPSIEPDLADELAAELGDLPLALEQAAGYIEARSTPPATYLRLFRAKREEMLAEGSVPDHSLLDQTWAMSVEQLEKEEPAAVMLLGVASFLAPDSIGLDLFAAGNVVDDELDRERALGRLAEYALIHRAGAHIQVHRLIQAAVRRSMAEDVRELTLKLAVYCVRLAAPERNPHRPESWPDWEPLLAHVLTIATEHLEGAARTHPEATSWLLDRAGRYVQARGEPAQALPLMVRALDIAEHTPELGDERVVERLSNLALVLRDLGRPGEARPLLERAVDVAARAGDDDNAHLASTLGNLGAVLTNVGELREARPVLERAIEIGVGAYGADSVEVAGYRSALGLVARTLGDPGRARELFSQALVVYTAVLGEEHPTTATGLNNVALVLMDEGDVGRARALLERSLAIREAVYGPEHPVVGVGLANLGGAFQELGDLDAARVHFERALRLDERALGAEHYRVADDLSNLALVLERLGDSATACSLLKRALAIRESTFAPDHPDVARTLDNLAKVEHARGNADTARLLSRRAYDIERRALGDDHPDTASTRAFLVERLGEEL
jgi:tetratricopeptide (TPR) repeat protein